MEDPQIHRLGVFFMPKPGGGSGIRTHDTVAHIAVFKTAAFVRSAIPPVDYLDKIISLRPRMRINHSIRPASSHLPKWIRRWAGTTSLLELGHYLFGE